MYRCGGSGFIIPDPYQQIGEGCPGCPDCQPKEDTNMSTDYVNPNDYKDAITVQDACNLSGVAHSFSAVMEKISKESSDKGYGTDWKNTHIIAVMYASKIASLTRCENLEVFREAYGKCKRLAPNI